MKNEINKTKRDKYQGLHEEYILLIPITDYCWKGPHISYDHANAARLYFYVLYVSLIPTHFHIYQFLP